MPRIEPLGLKAFDSLHFYVRDLARARSLLVDKLDFAELGESDDALTANGRQKSIVFQAGQIRFVVSEPRGEGGRAARFLRKHPEGVGTVAFEVEDIDRCWALLEARGGTPITDIQRFEDGDGGRIASFSITTAFGDTTFRFFQRDGYRDLYPGIPAYDTPRGGRNRFGFDEIDHITSNFETMAPALLWMEHVLGFERYWDVAFHTTDVSYDVNNGSGLKSVVMHDPHSGLKFANNEPWRPFFKKSQINVFAEDHRGNGVQHAAITTPDILQTVRALRKNAVPFMPTPGAYYDMLPDRLQALGIEAIDEDIDELRELEILVDGAKKHNYLLQIFLQEAAVIFGDKEAGPFFFEIIQRKGDKGFGAGNFRALFESIERQQTADGRI
ncbi:MAG: 4-hydroxyphenylpyruvate dioxygenase [Alphaproteobacteria bacterium]|nr:4-hydroxyphenylpyruvate dioxygenase [Alphaproteobacteria bacterium]